METREKGDPSRGSFLVCFLLALEGARASPFTGSFFYKNKEVMEEMARSRVEQWLTEEGLLRIQGWARDGLTDKQIAHNMG